MLNADAVVSWVESGFDLMASHPWESAGAAALGAGVAAYKGARLAWKGLKMGGAVAGWIARKVIPSQTPHTADPFAVEMVNELAVPCGAMFASENVLQTEAMRITLGKKDVATKIEVVGEDGDALADLEDRRDVALVQEAVRTACQRAREEEHAYRVKRKRDAMKLSHPRGAQNVGAYLAGAANPPPPTMNEPAPAPAPAPEVLLSRMKALSKKATA
jgi:hypothetical protein